MALQEIEGLENIKRNMSQLETKMQKKLVRHALRQAAKPIRDEAKRQAKVWDDPETPETIWKQIATRALGKRAVRGRADLGVAVGLKDSKPGEKYHYAMFVLKGTSRTRAHPVLRNAAETRQSEAIDNFVQDLHKGIENAVNEGK